MNAIINLTILAGLILIHESGHMLAGYILGIPKNKMAIGFINREKKKNFIHAIIFCITPHLALLDDDNQKIAPSPNPNEMERYVEILENYIPCEKRLFWFVAGGHVFEFIIIISIAVISLIINVKMFQQVAFEIIKMALILATIYLLTELFSFIKSKELTGGDFTGQWEISPVKTIMLYLIYFTGLIYAWSLLK
ncbi:MAG: hypothetical protein JJT76_06255 [Clostridiaceae bacterium]|nr:hypothetical protein [Clostridiaceae bacterium]